ncbi:hypothetical protein QQ73_01800, partial [Candidatus Endoriftia persephone str. Guaymas]|nr:hypothetical protein [Candidatus Endoriftia persephone str. Guaymas]
MKGQGNMPMMGGGKDSMPMMKMMQEKQAMMQEHMKKMETHMANIEALSTGHGHSGRRICRTFSVMLGIGNRCKRNGSQKNGHAHGFRYRHHLCLSIWNNLAV